MLPGKCLAVKATKCVHALISLAYVPTFRHTHTVLPQTPRQTTSDGAKQNCKRRVYVYVHEYIHIYIYIYTHPYSRICMHKRTGLSVLRSIQKPRYKASIWSSATQPHRTSPCLSPKSPRSQSLRIMEVRGGAYIKIQTYIYIHTDIHLCIYVCLQYCNAFKVCT